MKRNAVLAYGAICYAIFFATFLYAIGWVGNVATPTSVDVGITAASSIGEALAIDLALLSLFAIQHSGMARPGFKRVWTRLVPWPAERATYVLATCAALGLMFWQWRPIGGTIWEVEGAGRTALNALYLGGWGLVLYATTLIDHFDLFGLRQAWIHWRGERYSGKPFMTPALYRYIRHPLYVGWLVVFWATPVMTAGHLVLAGVVTGYILVAVRLEERDLLEHLGERYARWRETTPAFVPRLRRRPARGGAQPAPASR